MRWLFVLILVLASAESCQGRECVAGQSRACTSTLDGGVTQRGYEACSARGMWSECVAVGACSAAGAALPVYARCTSMDDCGSASCAVCGDYQGIDNPGAYSVCHPYCQADTDCAPTTASAGVTARCVLGQCLLLCRTGARCPVDGTCMPWSSSAFASNYAGFDGLCD